MTGNPTIHPSEEDKAILFGGRIADAELERLRTRVWTTFKAGI